MGDSIGPNNRASGLVKRCFTRKRSIDTGLWISVLTVLILSLGGVIPPRMSGFYCNDQYITQKFTGDTISAGILISSCIFVPIILILIIESINFKVKPSQEKINRRNRIFGCTGYSGGVISDYLLGFLLTLTVTDLIKSMVGEKRPHFLDTCQPSVNCSTSHSMYITDYVCTARFSKWWLSIDIHKSFPSGHASLAFFMAVFMILYLQKRVSLKVSHLLRPVMQVLFLLWAICCCVSRVVDNRHFWWDVLAGASIGIFSGYATIVASEQTFQPKNQSMDEIQSEETSITAKSSSMVIIRNSNADN